MNQQQETLNKEIEIPGKLIASISRSIGKYLTNYTIYFIGKKMVFLRQKLASQLFLIAGCLILWQVLL